MCYVKVHCYHCGADYEIYSHELGIGQGAVCPHCLTAMDPNTHGKIYNALMCLEEVNKDFRKNHSERGEPLFSVEIRNHHVPNDLFFVEGQNAPERMNEYGRNGHEN